MSKSFFLTQGEEERAILVGVELKGKPSRWSLEDSLAELAQLARTAGVQVVGQTYQKLERINPATLIGPGKVEELKAMKEALGCNLIIFDEELSPRQQRELEKALKVKIIDRTVLILDIFARHAKTHEGRIQVELAQYQYRLPRLTRYWTHLSRQVGGPAGGRSTMRGPGGGSTGVGLRGPGETQLEMDRRRIKERIAHLKEELEHIKTHRQLYRQRRKSVGIPIVAIVGYTNAGKSTLLNSLANANVLVEDKLFATLDPTTRRVKLPSGKEVLVTDTVGFIQKLPPQLLAAFRATLEEVLDADIIIHVVDITSPHALNQSQTVWDILRELGANHKPIITALNKIDKLEDPSRVEALASYYPNVVPISALKKIGLDRLMEKVEEILRSKYEWVELFIPYTQSYLLSLFRQWGIVESEEHRDGGVHIRGYAPPDLASKLARIRSTVM